MRKRTPLDFDISVSGSKKKTGRARGVFNRIRLKRRGDFFIGAIADDGGDAGRCDINHIGGIKLWRHEVVR